MKYKIFTLAKRPELARHFDTLHTIGWPEFMLHDEVADTYFHQLEELFPQFQFCLVNEEGDVIAGCNSIPFCWDGTVEGLPSGWDRVLIRGIEEYRSEPKPNAVSALSIVIDPALRGKGISRLMIIALKELVKNQQMKQLIAPVRPSFKHKYPHIPMHEYAYWKKDDGSPFDPWIRTHWKIGANILKIAPESMIIKGTVADWEIWTEMKFLESGTYHVPGALVPVTIDVEKNSGCYVEPNVWMQHIM
ncbi:GNAT family N-acetyltransferase [Brevibacillus daliensis]|uniref:GNAT family N-acetyltransferase n=1 Tax=Brevibacillus daliensis TaxID=2892995 RepID=UPI001E446F2D|nr:GNAT family N-acetyltransferase [Brevibacillus daliensis]